MINSDPIFDYIFNSANYFAGNWLHVEQQMVYTLVSDIQPYRSMVIFFLLPYWVNLSTNEQRIIE